MKARRTPYAVAGLLLLGIGLISPAARAGQVCSVGATGMAFGVYDPLAAAPNDSTSTVSVTCTSVGNARVRYEVQLNTGQAASFNPRAMTNGASQLNYNLYRNAARTRIWGDGTAGTRVLRRNFRLAPVGSTQTDNHTVHGRIFAGQQVTSGSYLDTITVTVIF